MPKGRSLIPGFYQVKWCLDVDADTTVRITWETWRVDREPLVTAAQKLKAMTFTDPLGRFEGIAKKAGKTMDEWYPRIFYLPSPEEVTYRDEKRGQNADGLDENEVIKKATLDYPDGYDGTPTDLDGQKEVRG